MGLHEPVARVVTKVFGQLRAHPQALEGRGDRHIVEQDVVRLDLDDQQARDRPVVFGHPDLTDPDQSRIIVIGQLLLAMMWTLEMSPSTCAVVTETKPASASIVRAVCSPHMVPRPIPPSARETVIQCMHETV